MFHDVVCILAKAPVPGEAKTRLIPALGASGAAILARAFFADTLAMAVSLRWARVVVSLAGDPASLPLPPGVEILPQGGGDLGERMERAAVRSLAIGPRVLLIGTDSPGLPAHFLGSARASLATHEAVLGPAEDGGFFLLGLDRCEPGLLSGLPWSRSDTLVHTAARLRHSGRSVATTDPWFDVDEPADLERLSRLIAEGEIHAPATARALASLGAQAGARP